MNVQHLDRLVDGLRSAFPGGGREIARLLGGYAREHEDWRSFAFFDPAGYTRNQVARDEHFELLLLCWDTGQESPIHNHEGQDCWMAVLEGTLEELRYDAPTAGHGGPLPVRESARFDAGGVAFIKDEIGLHLVRPVDGPAVSLHLYAAPYDECSIYCPDTGRVTRKAFTNHSVRGVLVAT